MVPPQRPLDWVLGDYGGDLSKNGWISPLSLRPSRPTTRHGKPLKKSCQYYDVYYAVGHDTTCILNAFDIVPTLCEGEKEENPYLVITDTILHKWHIITLGDTKFVEVYCSNSCCVLSSIVDATVYIDAVKRGASEDDLLGILLDSQGHPQGHIGEDQEDEIDTMMFRIIYRIPLKAFSPQFIRENKIFPKNHCSMEDCRVVEVPAWLWWYMEPSDCIGVCDGCNDLPIGGLKKYLS